MSAKRIVRRESNNSRKGKTDWERLRNMSEEEIDRGAESDPDNPPWTAEELRNARLVLPSQEVKVPVSIRLDREVLDYFKEQGPGYQSRIGAVLLSYVRTHERDVAAPEKANERSSGMAGSAKTARITPKRGR
jgi:uncharacterized protein (DUF4415 family)